MSAPPQESLSGHFAERMSGRRLLACVFTTFQLDPGFFEQEVLPVFVDVSLSHAPALRLIQMEDLLRQVPEGIAVYYDHAGLVPNVGGAAKLDVARIPVRLKTGYFHPKNVIALVEPKEADEYGEYPKALIVAALSANLTRTGWWENVEVAHVEEIHEGDSTRLRAPLRHLLKVIRKASPKNSSHTALDAIRSFLRRVDDSPRRSKNHVLRPHLWAGPESLVEFLEATLGDELHGMHLDVISPFFDGAGESSPLAEILDAFEPRSCRVFLPKNAAGEALVRPALYEWVNGLDGVEWGELAKAVTRLGKSKDAGDRYVHAKVYRFYSRSPKREYLLVGSPNLTTSAHQHGGNVEVAFLVEVEPRRKPASWLEPEEYPATSFAEPDSTEDRATDGGTRLSLSFDWRTKVVWAHWEDKSESPRLSLTAQGGPLFEVDALPAGEWTELDARCSERIEHLLKSTSLVEVHGDGSQTGLLLIQEAGMAQKPSLLFHLSAEDILRYWALLNDAQRAAFLESRAPEVLLAVGGADLVTKYKPLQTERSMFDRFAGLFHAFSTLERAIDDALDDGRERDAAYRLFGRKYDSLGTLLERVIEPEPDEAAAFRDPVDRYLVALCAGQLLRRTREMHPALFEENADAADAVEGLQKRALEVRQELLHERPDGEKFLQWYEGWFLRHATEMGDGAA